MKTKAVKPPYRPKANHAGKEYFPGFGFVFPGTVADYFNAAYKRYRDKNRLKLAALERYHGMGVNEFKFRTRISK